MPDPIQLRRLIVLVPDQEVDEIQFSRAIRTLALARYLDVLLVAIPGDSENELSLRRRMATIASLVRDFQYGTETHLSAEREWVKALAEVSRPGDAVVYPPELTVSKGIGRRQNLSEAILTGLKTPLYPLPGFFHDTAPHWPRFLIQIPYWLVMVVIFAGFFVLENLTTQAAPGALGHLLILLLLGAEVGAIYLWTAIAG